MAYTSLLCFAVGVGSHLFYFRIGEHHLHGMAYLQLFALTCITSTFVLVSIGGNTILNATGTVATLSGCWLVGVYSSLLTYRLFFHPLHRYPGPILARLAQLWLSTQLGNKDLYHKLAALHKAHGRYVRIASNTLSIADPDVMQPAFRVGTDVIKDDWYDGGKPRTSMLFTRDKAVHDRRRRVWAPAFGDRALREYETTVQERNRMFVQRMGDFQGSAVNVSDWFNLYALDVVIRLSFGKDYGMLESGKRHWSLDFLAEALARSASRMPTWLFRLIVTVPPLVAGYNKFVEHSISELKVRVSESEKHGEKDVTSWLLKGHAGGGPPGDDVMLQGDAMVITVAGSDTTSATLTFLFYHIARDQSLQRKLREELASLTSPGACADVDIRNADHLNGAINETLRLHPPVSSGLYRQTSPQGLHYGDVSIPGGVSFIAPAYVMARDEDIYADATSFVPERWYSRPEMVKHPDAFAPFSMGSYNCIGRNLARMELRTLTAHILLAYEVSLAPKEDGTRILTETTDHFTIAPGQLDLLFTPLSEKV